jgi:hypothetical protein
MRGVTLALMLVLAAPAAAFGRAPLVSSYDAVLGALQDVCMPAAKGADPAPLATADGFQHIDGAWTLRSDDFSVGVTPPARGAACVVDVTHPYDDTAPARAIVLTLNDWANAHRGWALDRNDRVTRDGVEVTTRSWRGPGGAELAFVTRRHADGTPMQTDSDVSQLVFSPGGAMR